MTNAQIVKRQVCCRCLSSTDNYTTIHKDDNHRWHFCGKAKCQAEYARGQEREVDRSEPR